MKGRDQAKAFLLLIVVPIICGTVAGVVMSVIFAASFMDLDVSRRTGRTISLTLGGLAGLAIGFWCFRQLGIPFIARKLLPAPPWPSYPAREDRAAGTGSVRVEYRVAVWDVINFNLTQNLLSPLMGSLYLGATAFIFLCEIQGGEAPSGAALTAVLYLIGMCLFLVVILTAFYYTGSADSLLTDHVLEIRDAGLFESTRFNESLHYWPSITNVMRRPGFVAVYVSARTAHIIPTRAFESKEHLARFVALIREKKAAACSRNG
jgi:YcxB-like protein